MDFLTYLEKYERQDISKVKKIIESNKQKESMIIQEAFSGEYTSKKEAIFNLENYFISESMAPKNVDVDYVKGNLSKLKDKINSLTEGDIRIIIHNHEGGKRVAGDVEYEQEGAKPKRRGRPPKTVEVKDVPNDVIYDEEEVSTVDGKEVADEIESALLSDNSDELIEELSKLNLTEEELRSATDKAETGLIDENDDSKVAKAARIISKINSLD